LALAFFNLSNNFSKMPLLEPSNLLLSPLYQPFPFSSVCKCLDDLPPCYFINRPNALFHCTKTKRLQFLYFLLLLLAGDIELNPGPVSSTLTTSLNLSHVNTWSATCINADIDKPAV